MRPFLFLIFLAFCGAGYSQQIVDPCFASIGPLSKFDDSEDIVNLCKCNNRRDAANLIEWDGTQWLGTLESSNISRPPPEGCNVRALWIGYEGWTGGGEAFGLRLDHPLEPGKSYTFSFTYAKDGRASSSVWGFSPIVYTDHANPSLYTAYKVGSLPATVDWSTQSITFTASSAQREHIWLILHAVESSGTILSNCLINNPIQNKSLTQDTTLCFGISFELKAIENRRYSYLWSTGETSSAINIKEAGTYSVTVYDYKCASTDSVIVQYEDCEMRFVMPNVFTPNDDGLNDVFIPKDFNYIESATISIFNRWGERVFVGNPLSGWSGENASAGVYFYDLRFIDRKGVFYMKKGIVTLVL